MKEAAPTSTPQVGWASTSTLGFCMISRPTMNFWRLPPERDLASDSEPPHFTSKRAMQSSANLPGHAEPDEALASACRGGGP